jgi:hypothetical protein
VFVVLIHVLHLFTRQSRKIYYPNFQKAFGVLNKFWAPLEIGGEFIRFEDFKKYFSIERDESFL